jgi:hypothetical protein
MNMPTDNLANFSAPNADPRDAAFYMPLAHKL